MFLYMYVIPSYFQFSSFWHVSNFIYFIVYYKITYTCVNNMKFLSWPIKA